MAFRLKKKQSAQKNLRRVGLERLAVSLALIHAGVPDAAAVHELRKTVKHLRALLRLYAGADPRHKIDLALRAAGRSIRPLREADALIAAFDTLTSSHGLDAATCEGQRRDLMLALSHDMPDRAAALREHRNILLGLRGTIARCKISASGFNAIEAGLKSGWRNARRLMPDALRDPEGTALHDWRKRVKDHGYHAKLLHDIWPDAMSAHADTAALLGDKLGEARDAALLADTLDGIQNGKPIAELARKSQAKTMAEAAGLARRFFAEKPSHLANRWQRWWSLWQADRS